jgi:hypothetical protein
MVSEDEYKNALKIIKQYEKEQSEKWSCDKCVKQFMNPFDQYFCEDNFNMRKKNCGGQNFVLYKKQKPR